jgi:cytochrome d ubiquinol oxidase subunit I
MDPLILARLQFAITTVYHFFFVPLTLGLSILVAVMETLYVRTGQEEYKRLTKFWGKLFVINFAMGVVTGIVQEFQFGMNWSEYSRFVGDIFGAPLAFEALMAFFLESVFLGVWIFGWEKLSKGWHAVTIWLVAIASNVSALWILIANSFMQQPVGYAKGPGGGFIMTDFFAVLLNPNIWYQYPHVLFSGLVTATFFVMGVSAYHLLRKNDTDAFKRTFQLAATVGIVASILLVMNGHSQAQHMVQTQPMKIAAAEALWDSADPASLSLFTIGNMAERKDVFAIRIPSLLSLLAYNQITGEVKGINNLQAEYSSTYGAGNYVPPAVVTYWAFRIMVGAGFALVALAVYGVYLVMGDLFDKRQLALKIFAWGIVLPYLANTSGWLLTEVGRFPWLVFGLVKLQDGVSPNVTAGMLMVSLVGYVLVYGLLIVATVYLMRKYARAGLDKSDASASGPDEGPETMLVGAQDQMGAGEGVGL